MLSAFVAFIAGNIVAAQFSLALASAVPAMLIPLCCLGLGYAYLRVPSAALLGGLLVLATQQIESGLRIPASDARVDRLVTGSIVSLPAKHGDVTRFVFRVEAGSHQGSRYQLAWFRPNITLQAGDVFTLQARLSAPTGSINFDMFDYEKWMFTQRIHGRGYVLSSPKPLLSAPQCVVCVARVRAWFRSELTSLSSTPAVSTQLALGLGDTSLLSPQQWQVLNHTGTTHLLIVSGLHVGLVATLTYAFLGWVGCLLNLRIGITLSIAFGYAQLAGWGLPVQRAFLMTLVYFSAALLLRHIPLTSRWVAALFVVLLFDPLASLSRGFWLSFGVVYALIFALARLRVSGAGRRARVHELARSAFTSQWVAFLALLPVIGFYNHELPVGSLLSNLVAIPWVSLLIVPITLAALVFLAVNHAVADLLLETSSILIEWLWRFLNGIDDLQLLLPVTVVSLPVLMCALIGTWFLLLPKGLFHRWPGFILLMLLLTNRSAPRESPLVVTFLDVGQGLSVLIETPSGAVLYDTGPGFPGGYSAATQTLLPTLKARGHQRLHALVVSHSDDDHAGGVDTMMKGIPIQRLVQYGHCHSRWELGEVTFESFDLAAGQAVSDNAMSCLLKVSWGAHTILLTGDIEAAEEYQLTRSDAWVRRGQRLTLLSVPHHGSDSSSTPALLNYLMPHIAIVSSGYLNRFGHPVDQIKARYEVRGSRLLDTAVMGAIRVSFASRRAGDFRISSARSEPSGLWRRRSPVFEP